MSSPSEAPESPRARQKQPEESSAREKPGEFDAEPCPWVALSSIALVLGANDERAKMLAPGPGPDAADLLLDLAPPLRASYLVLPDRFAPHDSREREFGVTCILAACSSRLLFMASRGSRTSFDFFLGDANARTVARVPVVPFPLRFNLGIDLVPRRTIGLIADPRHPGHHMVVQLLTSPTNRDVAVLCSYSSATGQWTAKALASTDQYQEPWGINGVLAHEGLLWWIDVACGMLVCDPFADSPELRFVPLPPNCQMPMRHHARATMLIDDRRFIRPSEGKLRYVQITGPAYELFTLVNPEGPADHWRREYTVNFADVWDHPSYTAAGLTKKVVPTVALIDPNDADIVYFFLGTSLFAVDGRGCRVLGCQQKFFVDPTHLDLAYQYSGFIDAWELPPTLLGDYTSSGSSDDSWELDDIESLVSLMEIKSQPDGALGFPDPDLLSVPGDMAPPSESSGAEAVDQADAEPDQGVAETDQGDAEAADKADAKAGDQPDAEDEP